MGHELVVFRSSPYAERGFCGVCGTHIFHRPLGGPELALSVGLFEQAHRRVGREIFVDHKPGYYRLETDGTQVGSRRMALEWGPKLLVRAFKRLLRPGSS